VSAATLGERLRSAREARGLSLDDLSRRTHIQKNFLIAIETGDYSSLPPEPIYIRAFLKGYSEYVGLPWSGVRAEYEAILAAAAPPPEPPPPEPSQTLLPMLAGGVALLGLVVWLVLTLVGRPAEVPPANTQPPPVPAEPAPTTTRLTVRSTPGGADVTLDGFFLGETPILASPVAVRESRTLVLALEGYATRTLVISTLTDTVMEVQLEQVTPPPPTVTLQILDRTWLRVLDTAGNTLLEGQLVEAGSMLDFDRPVIVRAGNAGGVRVWVRGTDWGAMGPPGAVVERRYP